MEAHEIERCIDMFGTDLYRFCLSLCADRTDAEDLYQQTFLKALESSLTPDWGQNPKALFFSLAHNLWKSDRRRQARRSRAAPSVYPDEDTMASVRAPDDIEGDYIHKELLASLDGIIRTLPDRFRIPLILFYLSSMPVEHIAAIIKKPPGTVKSRLFKGRKLIKKRLEEMGYEERIL